MRTLSFRGFLATYVRELSIYGTLNINKLAREAANESPRLREPLFLYAAMTGKGELFRQAVESRGLKEFYSEVFGYLEKDVERLLKENKMSVEYQKVYTSFKAKRDRLLTDAATKELMRERILNLKEKKRITTYRLYTDLELNCGNLNAWLKHGDGRLVSLDTARRVLSYAETAI